MFEDTNAHLAAVVHPMFKLYWADDVIKKEASLTDLLKRRVQSVSTQSASSSSVPSVIQLIQQEISLHNYVPGNR